MKVSDRIKEIRNVLDSSGVDRTVGAIRIIVSADLIQLEAEVVEALQAARQEGWDAGYRWQCIEQLETDKGGHKAALQEARQEGYLNGYRDGYTGGYKDGIHDGSDDAASVR